MTSKPISEMVFNENVPLEKLSKPTSGIVFNKKNVSLEKLIVNVFQKLYLINKFLLKY